MGELHAVPFEQGIPRVYSVLKLDERRDRPGQTLDDKVRSVEEKLELRLGGGRLLAVLLAGSAAGRPRRGSRAPWARSRG